MDVTPVVDRGRLPAKATVGEPFPVTAKVFREGHDKLAAEVVTIGPDGRRRDPVRMEPDAWVPDLYRAWVTPDSEGAWQFEVQAWSDPLSTWAHNAGIKVPAGVDVELMFTEGRLLLQQVQKRLPRKDDACRGVVKAALEAARDTKRPEEARLAAMLSPEVRALMRKHPIRELVRLGVDVEEIGKERPSLEEEFLNLFR